MNPIDVAAPMGQDDYEAIRILQVAVGICQLGLNTNDLKLDSFSGLPKESQSLMGYDGLRSFGAPAKKQNTTAFVPVPTSEHVAEIIGRQGCKIKELRAKTRAYIKTPERGDEPVFVVTGRREDVEAAKQEILLAADHFSRIRAMRKRQNIPLPPASVSGLITIEMRVPYCVVGLVVGPKGSTVKHIQQQTHTYIVTPSRDQDPVFEITGRPENVALAQQHIQAHISFRTGNASLASGQVLPTSDPGFLPGFYEHFSTSYDSASSPGSEEGYSLFKKRGGNSMSSSLSSLSCPGFNGLFVQDHSSSGAQSPVTPEDPVNSVLSLLSEYNPFQREATTNASAFVAGNGLDIESS